MRLCICSRRRRVRSHIIGGVFVSLVVLFLPFESAWASWIPKPAQPDIPSMSSAAPMQEYGAYFAAEKAAAEAMNARISACEPFADAFADFVVLYAGGDEKFPDAAISPEKMKELSSGKGLALDGMGVDAAKLKMPEDLFAPGPAKPKPAPPQYFKDPTLQTAFAKAWLAWGSCAGPTDVQQVAEKKLDDAIADLWSGKDPSAELAAGKANHQYPALAARALLELSTFARRVADRGMRTAIPDLANDPDCNGDLFVDGVLQRIFQSTVKQDTAKAYQLLGKMQRGLMCLHPRQSVRLDWGLAVAFYYEAYLLQQRGLDPVILNVAEALYLPALLVVDQNKVLGPTALYNWLREQTVSALFTAQSLLPRGVLLYDRSSGTMREYLIARETVALPAIEDTGALALLKALPSDAKITPEAVGGAIKTAPPVDAPKPPDPKEPKTYYGVPKSKALVTCSAGTKPPWSLQGPSAEPAASLPMSAIKYILDPEHLCLGLCGFGEMLEGNGACSRGLYEGAGNPLAGATLPPGGQSQAPALPAGGGSPGLGCLVALGTPTSFMECMAKEKEKENPSSVYAKFSKGCGDPSFMIKDVGQGAGPRPPEGEDKSPPAPPEPSGGGDSGGSSSSGGNSGGGSSSGGGTSGSGGDAGCSGGGCGKSSGQGPKKDGDGAKGGGGGQQGQGKGRSPANEGPKRFGQDLIGDLPPAPTREKPLRIPGQGRGPGEAKAPEEDALGELEKLLEEIEKQQQKLSNIYSQLSVEEQKYPKSNSQYAETAAILNKLLKTLGQHSIVQQEFASALQQTQAIFKSQKFRTAFEDVFKRLSMADVSHEAVEKAFDEQSVSFHSTTQGYDFGGFSAGDTGVVDFEHPFSPIINIQVGALAYTAFRSGRPMDKLFVSVAVHEGGHALVMRLSGFGSMEYEHSHIILAGIEQKLGMNICGYVGMLLDEYGFSVNKAFDYAEWALGHKANDEKTMEVLDVLTGSSGRQREQAPRNGVDDKGTQDTPGINLHLCSPDSPSCGCNPSAQQAMATLTCFQKLMGVPPPKGSGDGGVDPLKMGQLGGIKDPNPMDDGPVDPELASCLAGGITAPKSSECAAKDCAQDMEPVSDGKGGCTCAKKPGSDKGAFSLPQWEKCKIINCPDGMSPAVTPTSCICKGVGAVAQPLAQPAMPQLPMNPEARGQTRPGGAPR